MSGMPPISAEKVTGPRQGWVSAVGRAAPGTVPTRPKIAIVGAGIAGLTAALDALDAGYEVHLFEEQDRIGGKMKTGQLNGHDVEQGAEIVDATHRGLIETLSKIGIKEKPEPGDSADTLYLVDRAAEKAAAHGHVPAGESLDLRYYVDGKTYTGKDFLNPDSPGGGAFAAMHAKIVADQHSLRDAQGNWTDAARALDQLSAEQYLQSHADLVKDSPWIMPILKNGYVSEIGQDLDKMSALNLIDFIGTDPKEFSLYSSDEMYRIPGGAGEVMRRMKAKLETYGDQLQYHGRRQLVNAEDTSPGEPDSKKQLTFHNLTTGQAEADVYDAVVTTLPPKALLRVNGVEALGVDAPRREVLENLQYNRCMKVTVAAHGTPWATDAHGQPTLHNGEAVSNGAYQCAWPNVYPDGKGTITFLIGGDAVDGNIPALIKQAMHDYARDLGKPVDAVFDTKQAPLITPWAQKQGCYPAPSVGQYTKLAEFSRSPSAAPNAQLAGNYINMMGGENCEEIGFMNCAAESAHKAIAQIQEKVPVITHSAALQARAGLAQEHAAPLPR